MTSHPSTQLLTDGQRERGSLRTPRHQLKRERSAQFCLPYNPDANSFQRTFFAADIEANIAGTLQSSPEGVAVDANAPTAKIRQVRIPVATVELEFTVDQSWLYHKPPHERGERRGDSGE